jgi:hypothetical protein
MVFTVDLKVILYDFYIRESAGVDAETVLHNGMLTITMQMQTG